MKTNRREFLAATSAAALYASQSGTASAQEEAEARQSGYTWPRNQYLPSFRRPRQLDAADIQTLAPAEQILLTTLQGVVNRKEPSLYWFLSGDKTDQTWLATFGVPNTITADPLSLVNKYSGQVRGAIVYDPQLPDSINVATSLAGLKDCVVATAELAATYQLPIITDLRGRFSNKLAAYRWLIDNYWPQLNHRLLTGLTAAQPRLNPDVPWATLSKVTAPVTDASNRGTYTADLTGLLGGEAVYVRYADAYTNDGWGPSVGRVTIVADGNAIASFQPGTADEQPYLYEADGSQLGSAWRFADGGNYFIYRFVPPQGTKALSLETEVWNSYFITGTNTPPIEYPPFPNFRDYVVATKAMVFALDPLVSAEADLFREILAKVPARTPYLGWFIGGHENSGVTLCAEHGVPVVAADYFNNGTVLGGIRRPVRPTQPNAPVPQLQNKIYVTFTMSEGDNLQFCQHRMRSLWDDANRGRQPINWSISALLLDAAPGIYNYFQSGQTANDYFVAGPSGVAYTYPGAWPSADLPVFTRQTGRYMARTGLDVIYALNRVNDENVDFTDAIAAQYQRDAHLDGILGNWISESRFSQPSGLPVMTQIGISSVDEGKQQLAKATAGWDSSKPFFVAIGILAWNMTPTDVNNLIASLASTYETVRADAFFQLLRQAQSK